MCFNIIPSLGINARKMSIRMLAIVFTIWYTTEWYSYAEDQYSSTMNRYHVLPTHSNFLKSHYFKASRMQHVWCAHNASICHDRDKNPLGGTTCCWNKFCKDTTYDSNHCGNCGNACGYGLSCCGGRCVDLYNNKNHCGSCDKQCPSGERCSFGMCGYNGGYMTFHH